MKYGWKRDLPDHRDHIYHLTASAASLPAASDLRPQCPVVYDQSSLGACTGNCLASMVEYIELKENFAVEYTPSRLFIYYYERLIEHTVNSDSGAELRDGMKVLVNLGAPHEKYCPYIIANYTQTPPIACYNDALKHKVTQYQRLNQNINSFKTVLAGKDTFVFGFTVYESFESQEVARTGLVPMPSLNERVVGGHAVHAVGYDDADQIFWVKNSWGPTWGINGYFKMPYAYLTNPNLSSDFWTGKMVK